MTAKDDYQPVGRVDWPGITERVRALIDGCLAVWGEHESAPRTVCPECQFESSKGYKPSHAPGCSHAR